MTRPHAPIARAARLGLALPLLLAIGACSSDSKPVIDTSTPIKTPEAPTTNQVPSTTPTR